MLLSGILAKVNKPNKIILISHKHKLIPQLTHIGISLTSGGISLCLPMCASYGISLCLCEIRIYLFGWFTFAKIPDNNTNGTRKHLPQILLQLNIYEVYLPGHSTMAFMK